MSEKADTQRVETDISCHARGSSDCADSAAPLKASSEQRQAERKDADYLLEFSVAGRDNSGVGHALDQSETGMCFVTVEPLEQGSYLTMRVELRSETVPLLTCLANVVRCLNLPDGTGYAVACAYD